MRIARRRATLDIMMVEQTNPDWIQMRREFVRLKERGHLSQWAAPDKATSEEFTVIKSYLNRYEIISIGVRRGTLSERIYKEWWRTAFVEDWIAVKPLVLEIRNRHSPKFFIEYEWLAKRWASIDERERV